MPTDILAFLQNNLLLVAVCLVSGGMLIWPLIQKLVSGGREVSAQQAVQLINRKDAVVLDVRDAAEFATGHIPNARHMPVAELDQRLKEIEKYKQRPIVVACRSGNRSVAACALLRKQGFAEVFSLKGGIQGWQQANMPIEK
jgi:rhodanese-related sulfurtransferase